jgi:hypothetical protein
MKKPPRNRFSPHATVQWKKRHSRYGKSGKLKVKQLQLQESWKLVKGIRSAGDKRKLVVRSMEAVEREHT